MDVEMLKDARTQSILDCILISCVILLICFYILWFSKPQTSTHCVLAFLILSMPQPPGNPPVFGPCRPDSAGQAPRRGKGPTTPPKARLGVHSAREIFSSAI